MPARPTRRTGPTGPTGSTGASEATEATAARGASAPSGAWTARRFFDLLGELGPLRVISVCGPSVFEALCDFGAYGVADGHMNAMRPDYHWHVDLERFRSLRSREAVHERSGRRVLFFELAEGEGEEPFVRVYLYRRKGEDFGEEREARFRAAHAELAGGRTLAPEAAARRAGGDRP